LTALTSCSRPASARYAIVTASDSGIGKATAIKMAAAGAIQINRSLIYPGSRTIVDMSDSGGAVLQLETPDALEKVRAWYEANLKPTKTLTVTSTSVIQKKENVTVTLVTDDKLTSIVIKQVR
jgi:hypothetical protein